MNLHLSDLLSAYQDGHRTSDVLRDALIQASCLDCEFHSDCGSCLPCMASLFRKIINPEVPKNYRVAVVYEDEAELPAIQELKSLGWKIEIRKYGEDINFD